jgi:hypothetical protein
MGIVLFGRGRGKFDHHPLTESETTTSLVAKELGLTEDPIIKELIKLVARADLLGESLPFSAPDIIKCMQRLEDVPDEDIIRHGMRMVEDGIKFRQRNMARDNQALRKLIEEFLKGKDIIPPKFEKYLKNLEKPGFQRNFDLVEVLAVEGENAKDFILLLLDYVYRDSLNYLMALDEAKTKRVWKVTVKGRTGKEITIVAAFSDNPMANAGFRVVYGAQIVIQKKSNGHTGIFFDPNVPDGVIDTLAFMVRLEECLIKRREVPRKDLTQPGLIEGIPE